MRRSLVAATAGLSASCLVLAACAGGGAGGGAEATGPIHLGQIASLTGNYTPLGKNDKYGAAQAVQEINASGGLLDGRKLKITVKDDKTQPDQALIAYNDLVSSGVVAVVGSSFSNSSLAVTPRTDRKQVLYMSTAASDEQVTPVHDYVFMTPPTAGVVAEQLLRYFQAQGLRKMAVAVNTDQAFAKTGWQKMKSKAAAHGVTFVQKETFETSTTNFSSVLTHVRNSGAQGLMVWATGSPAVIVTKQFTAAGLEMPLVMSHAEASTLYTEPAGKAANGVIVATSLGVVGPYLPESKVKKVTLEMAETFQKNHGYYPPQFGFDGYNAVKLIAAAIEKAGSTDPPAIQQAMEQVSLVTPEGKYSYGPDDHAGLGVEDVAIAVVKDGDFHLTDWSKQQLAKTFG